MALWTSLPGSSAHGISVQGCWSGLAFPTPGDLPDPQVEPTSPLSHALAAVFFTTVPPGRRKSISVFNATSIKNFMIVSGVRRN